MGDRHVKRPTIEAKETYYRHIKKSAPSFFYTAQE
jgi:hypothetical protein